MFAFSNVVLITGGSSGIGFETALKYAKNNYKIALVARNESKLNSASTILSKLCKNVLYFSCDVSNFESLKEITQKIYDDFHSIDILVNSAGIMHLSFIKENKSDEWNNTISTNLNGVINSVAAVLPYMREKNKGHIVNVGSIFSYKVEPYGVIYSATKHAIKAYTEGLYKELRLEKSDIYVSLVSPGPVDTNLVKNSPVFVKKLSAEYIADIIFKITRDNSFKNVTEIVINP